MNNPNTRFTNFIYPFFNKGEECSPSMANSRFPFSIPHYAT